MTGRQTIYGKSTFVADTPLKCDEKGNLTVNGAKGTRSHTTASPGVSATLLLAANSYRKVAYLQNAGTADVFIGPSGVATTTGFKLVAGATFEDNNSTAAWYGIVSTGTGDIRVIEVS